MNNELTDVKVELAKMQQALKSVQRVVYDLAEHIRKVDQHDSQIVNSANALQQIHERLVRIEQFQSNCTARQLVPGHSAVLKILTTVNVGMLVAVVTAIIKLWSS